MTCAGKDGIMNIRRNKGRMEQEKLFGRRIYPGLLPVSFALRQEYIHIREPWSIPS